MHQKCICSSNKFRQTTIFTQACLGCLEGEMVEKFCYQTQCLVSWWENNGYEIDFADTMKNTKNGEDDKTVWFETIVVDWVGIIWQLEELCSVQFELYCDVVYCVVCRVQSVICSLQCKVCSVSSVSCYAQFVCIHAVVDSVLYAYSVLQCTSLLCTEVTYPALSRNQPTKHAYSHHARINTILKCTVFLCNMLQPLYCTVRKYSSFIFHVTILIWMNSKK